MGGEFDDFFDAHYDRVLRSLSLAFGDRGRAEEATQEAFARAWRRWGSVSALERPVAWVYVVATNEARRFLRRSGREAPAPAGGGDDRPAPDGDPAGAVATAVSLRAALAALAPRQRTAVVLRYLAGLSLAEVAAAMGCAEGTAKSTLHAALGRLRIELSDEEGR